MIGDKIDKHFSNYCKGGLGDFERILFEEDSSEGKYLVP